MHGLSLIIILYICTHKYVRNKFITLSNLCLYVNLLNLHEFFEFYIKQNSSTLYAQRNAGPNTDKGQNILKVIQHLPWFGDLKPKVFLKLLIFGSSVLHIL